MAEEAVEVGCVPAEAHFCEKFGETTPADFIEGTEEKFSTWLHGLKNAQGTTLSATRRMQIRIYALMMLEYAGAHPDRKKVARPDMNESRAVNDTTKNVFLWKPPATAPSPP